jgi:NADH:ubiquinone oxidoreductase subunit 2 (subunit N)
LAIIPKIALITIASEIVILISSSNLILNDVNKLILFVSTLSMVIGAIGALTQPLIKRLLTYSSIGQLGFILLGLGIGAQDSAFFYLTQYTVTNTGI